MAAPAVYLVCFAHNPYKHARHYLGLGDPEAPGASSGLVRAVVAAGGTVTVADVWDCRDLEEATAFLRQLQRQRSADRLCSICHPGNRRGTGQVGRPRTRLQAPESTT